MNFELSDDQRMLVDAAASFAKKQSPVTRMRKLRTDPTGWSRDVWRQMGELGWLGLAFPESVGGIGGTFVDVALILEQLGATLVPEPIVSSLVAGSAILAAGDAAQQRTFLAPMVAGQSSLALAWAEVDSRHDPTGVTTRASGTRITGRKRFVLDGAAASHFVVSATSGSRTALYVVAGDASGVKITPVRTIDGRAAAHVAFDGAEGVELAGDGTAALDRALDIGAAAACAEGIGIMRAVLAMTVEYLRTREQFGVKIGSFQVLQHRAVDMFIETELAKSTSIAASIRIDDPDVAERRLAVSTAKVQLGESGRLVTQQAIQLHGGIGITDEHDVGLFFKRMLALNATYGDVEHHVARLASSPSFAVAGS